MRSCKDIKTKPISFSTAVTVAMIVKKLSKEKSLIEAKDEDGNTALHLAASSANALCVETLLNFGANADARYGKS